MANGSCFALGRQSQGLFCVIQSTVCAHGHSCVQSLHAILTAVSSGMYDECIFDGMREVTYHNYIPSQPKEALNIHSRFLFSEFWRVVATVSCASFEPFELRFFHNALMRAGRTIRYIQGKKGLEDLAHRLVFVAYLRRFSVEVVQDLPVPRSMTTADIQKILATQFNLVEGRKLTPWEMMSESGRKVVNNDLLAAIVQVGGKTTGISRISFAELVARLIRKDVWGLFREGTDLEDVEIEAFGALTRLLPQWLLFNTACTPKAKRLERGSNQKSGEPDTVGGRGVQIVELCFDGTTDLEANFIDRIEDCGDRDPEKSVHAECAEHFLGGCGAARARL